MSAIFWMVGLHAVVAHERDRDRLKEGVANGVLKLEHLAVMVARLQKCRNTQQTR